MEYKGIHDEVFKKSLSELKQAQNFIKSYLPHKILKLLSLKTIKFEKDTFIDEDDSKYFADLLFSVKLNKNNDNAFVYILFEHKSQPEKRVLLQLLGYMVNIWKEAYRNYKVKLPRIIPVVVYHGRSKWYVPKMLSDMFNPMEELDDFLPDFGAKIVNLQSRDIRGSHSLRLLIWALKHAFDENPIKNLIEIKESFLVSLKEESFQFDLVVSYLTKIEKIPYKEVFRKISDTLKIGVDEMELMSETFRKKGWAEGKVERDAEILELADKVSSLEELKKYLKASSDKGRE